MDGPALSDAHGTVITVATRRDPEETVELTRQYGLWNSARHFCWNHAIPEAESDDVDALAAYWAKLRDDVRERRIARKVNIAADQGVIAEMIDGVWIPRYFAVEPGVAEEITGRKRRVKGIECLGQAGTYGAARCNNKWYGTSSADFSDADCPLVTIDLDADSTEPELEAAIALGDEIERRYAERVVRQRLHQPELRKMSLEHHGTACAYCGMDVPQIVEAAHLVADSEGGAASVENTRPMCPNHHRAFDVGLLVWDGNRFESVDGAPSVGPAPDWA
ncbi:MAG: hypothetical protein QM809_14580 [Gordonia sp. (in: high G+C Gram-positive bacteria)]|uniref:HNH endonuclease n=1 Tax=Gordonia sp. (in: high G+C Gram-positive bacteria) TaxID=84139 RepID=UPI0039E3D020